VFVKSYQKPSSSHAEKIKKIFPPTCLTDRGAAAGDDEDQKGFFVVITTVALSQSPPTACKASHKYTTAGTSTKKLILLRCLGARALAGGGCRASVRRGRGCPTLDTAGSSGPSAGGASGKAPGRKGPTLQA